MGEHPGTMEPGDSGGNFPPNLEAVGAPPIQLRTVNVINFYFRLLLKEGCHLFDKKGVHKSNLTLMRPRSPFSDIRVR